MRNVILLILLSILYGCDSNESMDSNGNDSIDNNIKEEEPDIENNPLTGTMWKCVGIVDVETGTLTEIKPKEHEKCYTLIFNTKSSFTTWSSVNDLRGEFIIDFAKQSFSITIFGGTKVNEIGDDNLYTTPFWRYLIHSFSLEEKELKLYYNDKDHDNKEYYLFFSKEENGPLTGTTWKCAGIVDVETGTLTKFGEDHEKFFTITFDTDSHFSGWSSWNELWVEFKIDYVKQSFYITYSLSSLAMETKDGDLFTYPFWKRFIHSFSFEEKELKLYYNDKDYDNKEYYLLFNKIEP